MNLKRNLLITFVILLTWSGTLFSQRPDLPAPARRATPPPGLMPIDDYVVPVLILGVFMGIIIKIKLLKTRAS